MKKWTFKFIKTSCLFKDEISLNDFMVTDDKNYIYYHHKYYNIIETITAENGTIYHAECIRHTGKKHIKFETAFVVQPKAIGICESFFKEA